MRMDVTKCIRHFMVIFFCLLLTQRLLAQQPTITSFTPVSGAQRDTVTITGTNFTNILAVSFGGAPAATFIPVNSSTIKAVVGAGTTGKVAVSTVYGDASLGGFTFTGPPPPAITSFSPSIANAGSAITISGANFNTAPAKNLVYFGTVKGTVTTASTTSLSVIAPGGADYQPVSITTNDVTAFSNYPFVESFSGGGFIVPSSFDKNVDIQSGISPYKICFGDIDNDGKVDLVVVSIIDNIISVFKNTSTAGSVSFAGRVDFPTALSPSSVVIGDLNGDGKPDMITTNNAGGSSSISIFKNTSSNGVISFASRRDYQTGTNAYSYPGDAAIMDLDSDGRPDIVVANSDYTVSVFKNTGNFLNILLDVKKNYPVGLNARGIAINDFDGDGKSDIVATNNTYSTLSIIRNTSTNGIISFGTTVDLPSSKGPNGIATGDMDNDGKPDLIVMNQDDRTISVFKNTSSIGTITFNAKTDYQFGGYPGKVCLSDIDGDGKPDLTLANGFQGGFSVFKNTSNTSGISFEEPIEFDGGSTPNSIAITDIDGDGIPDAAVCSNDAKTISIFRNIVRAAHITSFTPLFAGPGTMVTIKGYNFNNASSVTFGDKPAASFTIVSDTVISAKVGSGSTGSVKVISSYGNGTASGFLFSNVPIINNIVPISGKVGTTVTITGANFSSIPNENTVYFGAAKAVVTTASANKLIVSVPVGANLKPISVTTSNLTAYSNKPFIVTFPGSPAAFLTGSFDKKQDISIPGTNSVCTADIDLDGKVDLIATDGTSNKVSVLRNISTSGIVSFAPRMDFTTQSGPGFVNTCDFDGDGKLDIVAGGATISVLKNTSTTDNISFAPKIDLSLASTMHAIGDLDGDGKPDIITISNNTLAVFRNTSANGTISFTVRNFNFIEGDPRGIAVCDFNIDGKPDIVITRSSDDVISIYPNTSSLGSISFGSKIGYYTGDGPLEGLSTADVDGDGKPDISIVNFNGSSISVLKNTSDTSISFDPKVDFGTATNPVNLDMGDVDGDGRPDIAVVHNYTGNGQTVSLLKNLTTSSSISFSNKRDFIAGNGPNSVCISDLDGDGKPEFIVASYISNFISIFRNKINEPLVVPSGSNPLNGNFTTNIIIDSSVQTYSGQPYVQRHYEIEPVNNPATATATVTLYFSQQEFDNFNASTGHGADLPRNSSDVVGIASLRIYQYHGFSATSVPGSYNGGGIEINPVDSSIVWNQVAQWWEITFSVTGFSGFFLSSEGFKYKQPPAVSISANGTTTFCTGGNILLTSSQSGNYQWYKNGIVINNATSGTYLATETGTYTATTSVNNVASPPSNGITIIVKPVPSKPLVSNIGALLLSSYAAGNQWYKEGMILPGDTSQTYKPGNTANYSVVATVNGCSSVESDKYYFVVTALVNVDNDHFIRLSPNPVTAQVLLTYNLAGTSSVHLQIIDMHGRICAMFNNVANGSQLNLTKLAGGVYSAKVFDSRNKKSYVIKIMKL